jgi:hypothetical protein
MNLRRDKVAYPFTSFQSTCRGGAEKRVLLDLEGCAESCGRVSAYPDVED